MARFVLVHGAWHGGWCFEPLAAELTARGHEVSAPDLPCDRVGLTVQDCAAVVGPQPDAVVVGHSLAGMVLPLVEARLAVFLAALVPIDGVYSSFPHPDFRGTVRDDAGRSYWPDAATARERLYPDLDDAAAAAAFARLRPQSPLEPVLRPPGGTCAYLLTRHDRAVRPEWQAEVARGTLGVEPIELDAGHWPMLTHPAGLADVLEVLA